MDVKKKILFEVFSYKICKDFFVLVLVLKVIGFYYLLLKENLWNVIKWFILVIYKKMFFLIKYNLFLILCFVMENLEWIKRNIVYVYFSKFKDMKMYYDSRD